MRHLRLCAANRPLDNKTSPRCETALALKRGKTKAICKAFLFGQAENVKEKEKPKMRTNMSLPGVIPRCISAPQQAVSLVFLVGHTRTTQAPEDGRTTGLRTLPPFPSSHIPLISPSEEFGGTRPIVR